MKKSPKYPIKVLNKSLSILEILLQQDSAMNMTEISERLEIYPSTIHRILDTLKYWGYIEQDSLTQKDVEKEKYYLVAQTFLSPNWGSSEVKAWFRHRKIVVVNPQNGQVMVGVLEDAGPEPSTGNSFGGSPEVMEVLGFPGGGSNVLFYFVDDPKDQIPLGSYGI